MMRELLQGCLKLLPVAKLLPDGHREHGGYLVCRGRRVAVRKDSTWARATLNLDAATIVLVVDLGCPRQRSYKGARRHRELLAAAASTLLMLGVVDPAEDA